MRGRICTPSLIAAASNRPPFDKTLRVSDRSGSRSAFITDPLDETYLLAPASTVPEGMLPPQEFEVRAALAELIIASDLAEEYGEYDHAEMPAAARSAWEEVARKKNALRELVNGSQEHKAAMRRLYSNLPADSAMARALAVFAQ